MSKDWAGGRRQRDEMNHNHLKDNTNPAKSGPRPSKAPAKFQQRKSLRFLRRIERYQRATPTPQWPFFFVRRFRLKGGLGAAQSLLVRAGVVPFRLHFGVLRPLEQVKGWPHFLRSRIASL
jgi:hypothetical protein